jgi:glycine oxidase
MQTDFLIIGQGLAGTLLAYELMQQGFDVQVIDNQHFEAATAVAGGLINPITGRRIVKTEQIDELLPQAKATYQALEKYLDIQLWQELNVLWSLSTIKEENDWYVRASQVGIKDYVVAEPDLKDILTKVKNITSFGKVRHAAQVNISLLISAFAKKLLSENRLLLENFDFDALSIDTDKIIYKNIEAKKIIFCEGHRGRFNPLFRGQNFAVAKGEALIIKAEDLPKDSILKNNITICPLPDGTFWAGSNYEWNPNDCEPTESIRNEFEAHLNDFLNVPYQVLEHNAAIRPTMKNRQILTIVHSDFPNVAMFNGLGTKGTSLAPYWAKHFAKIIIK